MIQSLLRKGLSLLLVLAMDVSLTTAPLGVQGESWPQFLGNETTQGVSDAATPVTGEELALRWEKNTGSSWNDVPGTPIVVGDYVYYYSSQYLRKLSLKTGEELAVAQVYGEPVNQFFISIAYGDGKIFVPLQKNNMDDNLDVEGAHFRVFDAETLRQLYITEGLGAAQMQTAVMYHDGYFVTGTYTGGRQSSGMYVCFDSEDEDPSSPNEVKKAVWKIDKNMSAPADEQKTYSFCWNGAAFVKDYCYFASADTLWRVKYQTGEAVSMTIGNDQEQNYASRSTVVYNEELNRLYVAVNSDSGAAVLAYPVKPDGTIDPQNYKAWHSHTKGGGTQSTPVIYNKRLYIGGGGYTMGSAETFHVVDAVSLEEIYQIPLRTKGSAAISNAYGTEENNQQVYVYMIPYAPVDGQSQLWIISDAQGQTEPRYEVVSGIGHPQYASQSAIIAKDGALLWYNDAGYLYCYEKKSMDAARSPF